MTYTKFCKCGRILTLAQMANNTPCDKCCEKEEQHNEEFHDKSDIKEEE